jgi:copper chaperone
MTHTIDITISDMTCGHCKASVEKALTQLSGVSGCAVDLSTKHVTVQADERVTLAAVIAAIEDAGFTAVAF